MLLTDAQRKILTQLDLLHASNQTLLVLTTDISRAFSSNYSMDIEKVNNILEPYHYQVLKKYFVPGIFGSRWIHFEKISVEK